MAGSGASALISVVGGLADETSPDSVSEGDVGALLAAFRELVLLCEDLGPQDLLADVGALLKEAEDTLVSMQELSQIQWPDDKRPGE